MIHHIAVVTAPPVKISSLNAASSIKKKKPVYKRESREVGRC